MDYRNAIILGLVEGITEFLPVSSTGHMILVGELLQANTARWHVFEVFVQLGAILAVVVLYWRRFLGLFDFSEGWLPAPKSFRGTSGLIKIALGCLPAFVLGALFHGVIKEHLFFPLPVTVALIVGAVLMIWAERRMRPRSIEELRLLSIRSCFIIGLFQCLALWPGMSRSAATIVGAMLVGGSRSVAAEFSFLIAVPTMCAAVGYDLLKNASLLSFEGAPIMALGFVVSFVTALIAVKTFIAFLQHNTLLPFAYYRIVLGLTFGYFLLQPAGH